MNKLILKIVLLITMFTGLIGVVPRAFAIDCNSPTTAKEQIQCGACDAAGSTDCDTTAAPKSLSDTIKEVINIISAIAGAIAVVMIIIGGLRYITSGGNAESAKNARNTIVYAIVGLIIIALAQIIVHFTLNTVASDCVNGKTPSGQACK